MAYTRKDVTNAVNKKAKAKEIKKTDDFMDKIDDAMKGIEPLEDTTEVIDEEIMSKIEDDVEEDLNNFKKDKPTKEKKIKKNNKPNWLVVLIIVATIICAGVFFIASIINSSSTVTSIISSSLLALFAIIYLVVCLTSLKDKVFPVVVSSLLLIVFFILNISFDDTTNSITSTKVINFSGKTLTDAVKWANNNNIKITQEYEFSDMVPEYEIISQSVKPGTNSHDIDEIVVAVSEGPNPYKEIIVPSMLTWDSERVINYVLSNYLNNVIVDFVESDQVKDTVIEQSKSGNLKRNDELKLVFSYGDLGNSDEVTLIDFTNMTKFEIEFFMKQHHINYNFEYDFSESIKKGYGIKQSISAGSIIKVDGDRIIVTISKGPKIEIPDLNGKSITEITEWAIENRLKLEFIDSYDDSVKKGKVISIDQEKGSYVEQGTTIKVKISLGGLKMPKFKNADDFYKWADKYGIKYEVQHQFSDSVSAGEIISFSHKNGALIKNNEAITVIISDGVKTEVPNLIGLTKNNAIKKLNAAGLNYNFVYKNSTTAKDKVLGQSISAGSEVSSGTTITVTLSNGKAPSGGNSGGGNSGGGNTPTPTPTPTPTCTPKQVFIYDALLSMGNPQGTCANIKGAYPTLNFVCHYVQDGTTPGMLTNNDDVDGVTFTSCDTINLYIVSN